MLDEHYTHVKKSLEAYNDAIEEMANVLLDVEVIEGKKVREIIQAFEISKGMKSRLAHGKKVADEEKSKKEFDDNQTKEEETDQEEEK